jgi:hypothetical protein
MKALRKNGKNYRLRGINKRYRKILKYACNIDV